MAEAVLVALELHDDLPRAGIGITATEIGLPRRTLQHALQNEGVSYRDIVLELRMRRAGQLLSTTGKTLAEVAMRAGYSNPSNFHRAFLSLTGMTPRRFRERSGPTRHRQRCLVEAGSDSRMAAVARPRPPSYWRSERQVSEFDQ